MRRAVLAAYRLRAPIYWIAAVLLITVTLSSVLPLGESASQVRSALAVGALYLFASCAALTVVLMFIGPRLLPTRETVVVAPPVHGHWLGLNSPASKVPSHGVRMYGQAYAIDLVAEPADADRPAFGGPAMRAPERYPAFGEPVFAMIGGTVVRASDRHRDHRARSNWFGLLYLMVEAPLREIGGPGFILGNHVTILGEDGTYATVAHLQRGSVAVRVGDTVHAGQRIGRCGNSGNSTEPHVHAQLMDRESVWTAQGVPMAFNAIALDGDTESLDALPKNSQHMTAPSREHDAGTGLGFR